LAFAAVGIEIGLAFQAAARSPGGAANLGHRSFRLVAQFSEELLPGGIDGAG